MTSQQSENIIYAVLTLTVIIGALLVLIHHPMGKALMTLAAIAGYCYMVFQNKKLKERVKELEMELEKTIATND